MSMGRVLTRVVSGVALAALLIGIGAVPAAASVGISLGTASRSFSPNNDGQDDTLTVEYCLSEAANLEVDVQNASAVTVQVLLANVSEPSGCRDVTWDGSGTSGATVANGAYTLAFHAESASGSDDATYATSVDTRLPGTLTTPAPGATLSGTQSFVFAPTAGFTGINSVAVDCIGEADAPAGNGTFTASGDTSTLCNDGSHTIAAHVAFTDGFGATHSWDLPSFAVTVQQPVAVQINTNGFPSTVFSPNGDSQDDTVTASYCLSRTATVTIVVKNSSGTVVRTVQPSTSIDADGANYNPGSCIYAGRPGEELTTWDGKNNASAVVPDGNYSIVIDAQDAQGNTASAVYETAVDTRLPGTVTVPVSGATLTKTSSFVFTPTAAFNGIDSVAVDCFDPGALQGNGTWTGSGNAPQQCAPTTATVSATVTYTDKFGTGHTWQSPGTPVSIGVEVVSRSASQSFSPNGDAQEDSLDTLYCVTRDSTVTITVHNAAHGLVRTLQSSVPEPGGCGFPFITATWNGRNTGGAVVADGAYTIDVHAVDGNGGTDDLSVPTTVDTRVPGVLTTPASGATLTGSVPFVFTPTAGFAGIQGVLVDCLGSGTLQSNGTWTGSGDTWTCAPNTTAIGTEVVYLDGFGSLHIWNSANTPVTIAEQLTRFAQAGPSSSFSPNGDGQDDTVTASYCTTDDATVTITVHNAAHALVRTLESGGAETATDCYHTNPNPSSVTWDGKNGSAVVVPNGSYTIDVHAVDGHGHADDLSIPTTVDNRVPGVLTTPAPGDTLSGSADFVFTPTTGFSGISAVSVDCIGSGALQEDGTWTGSGDTTSCGNGFVELHSRVTWTDSYGSTHTWLSPTGVPVTLSNVTLSGESLSQSFSPNGDGNEDTVTASYCLENNATVTVTVRNAGHALVRTVEAAAARTGAGCDAPRTTTWDGRDDAGDVVADGNYTIDVHAVATVGGVAGDVSIPTTVDDRAPGQLSEPHFGETLTGTVHFTFAPTAGFQGAGQNTITSVHGCFAHAGVCINIVNASPDGVWRTTIPSSELTNGADDFSWSVDYLDQYGTAHVWPVPVAVAVSINTNPNPVIAVSSSPSSGPAPLAAGVHVDLADGAHRPLAYDANFGDGSPDVKGTVASPYTGGVSLAHSYATPGSYLVNVTVADGAGGSAHKSVTVTVLGTEQPPAASLAVSPTSGTAPKAVTVTISATDPDSPTLTYRLDYGDGTTVRTGTATSTPQNIAHTYVQPGIYTVRFAVTDGVYTDVRARAVTVGLAEPLTANAGDDQTAIVNQAVHFDGSASRPLVGITSYNWTFPDGTATGAAVNHTFTTVGVQTVTLTVHAGAAASTDTLTVVVSPVPTTPGLHVTITGSAASVGGADVTVIDAAGTRHASTTNGSGLAILTGLPDGKYTVYAYHDGFLPGTGSATLANGSGSVTIALEAGSVGQTSMTSAPITDPAVLAADGIDPNDPANQNIYKFEIHLAFVSGTTTSNISFAGYTTSGSGGGSGSGNPGEGFLQPGFTGGTPTGGCVADSLCVDIPGTGSDGGLVAYPRVSYTDGSPTVLWMVIPGEAKWLKEFFNVSVVVSNLARSDFSFQHGTVSLAGLPAGVSLAPTAVAQSLVQSVPDVPGGQSVEATWVVRGDTEGFYSLAAQYSGTLEPTGSSIVLDAATSPNALHVWGGSALHLIVDTDASAVAGSPYRVRIGLQNVADVPMFNPAVTFLEQGRVNYIYEPGEILTDGTAVIQPGATYYTHYYRLLPEITGNLVPYLSYVKQTGGNATGVASSIVSHAAVAGLAVTGTRSGAGALTLTWPAPPVTGITGYRVYVTPTRDTAFGATPVATTGSSTRTVAFAHPSSGYYAISTLVNGVPTMFHTLFGAASTPVPPSAQPGNASATVSWSAPASNGGAPVTGYVVTPFRAGVAQAAHSFAATATSGVIAGLTNGTSYTFKVAATNANGTSPGSPASNAVTVGAPASPSGVTVASGTTTTTTGTLTVSYAAGANNGAAITKFTATCTSANGGALKSAVHTGATAVAIAVTGVTTVKTYTCNVTATNSRGASPPTAGPTAVTVGAPLSPTGVTANSGSTTTTTGTLTVSYAAGANNGAAITKFTATCTSANGGALESAVHTGATAVAIVVTGVTTGKTYACSVVASNVRGNSPAGTAAAVTVGAPAAPAKPTVVKSVSGSLAVTFAAPVNNGAAITGYTATCTSTNSGVTKTKTGTASPLTVTGLSAGKAYTCTVVATNSRGTGPPSPTSAAVTA
jgi:flagellar hook assembly protein FlgD/PKD repeat protein